MSNMLASMQPPPKPRKRKAATLRDVDWEPHKERIMELHGSGMTLEDMKRTMELDFKFFAENRQYKSRFKKWGLGKNVTSTEMRAIVRKRQQRKLLEPDRPELVFEVRGARIDMEKVGRWMSRHDVHEIETCMSDSPASTPSAVQCRTNSEPGTPAGRILSPEMRSTIQWASECASSTPRTVNDEFLRVIWWAYLLYHDLPQLLLPLRGFHHCIELTERYLEGQDLSQERSDLLNRPIHGLVHLLRYVPSHILQLPCEKEVRTLTLLQQVLEYWMQIGVDMEWRCSSGVTPFLYACRFGSLKYLSLLIEKGADVHVRDGEGRAALHFALEEFNEAEFNPYFHFFVVDRGPKVIASKILALVAAGCDPEATDHQGKTPLQCLKPESHGWRFWSHCLSRIAQGGQHGARHFISDWTGNELSAGALPADTTVFEACRDRPGKASLEGFPEPFSLRDTRLPAALGLDEKGELRRWW